MDREQFFHNVISNIENTKIKGIGLRQSDFPLVSNMIRNRKDFEIVNRFGKLALIYTGKKGVNKYA